MLFIINYKIRDKLFTFVKSRWKKIYNPIPVKRSSKYCSNYWETYSPKLKRNIRLFSDLEYDHWVLVETNPDVKCYCEQPFEFRCIYNGEAVKSIPDMWIQYNSGEEHFAEIK